MQFQQVRLPIDALVQRVRSGRLALPDFQREFVWAPSQIAELLDTVARQWPMGSLLLLNGTDLFEAREIDCAPKLSAGGPDLYLLDGQQRITSLFHAVTDASKYCYYVDFNALVDESSEIVSWMSRVAFEKNYGNIKDRARAGLALIKDIWEASSFFEWVNYIQSNEKRLLFLKLREERLSGFQANVYQVMAIELEEGIGLEALARIFETINRTGVALNAFDLLVAKLYPSKFMLRGRWEELLQRKPLLRHFNPNELEIMKLVSLLVRRDLGARASKGVRQGDILGLKSENIIEKWDEAANLYTSAIERVVTYGTVCKELMPSWSMVLGIAGCISWLDDEDTLNWWIDSIARQTFAQGANTKIVSEFDSEMSSVAAAQEELTAEELLRKSVKSNGLLAKGLAGLIIRKGARDPISGQLLLHSKSIAMKALIDNNFLASVKATDTLRNLVLVSGESESSLKGGSLDDSPHWKSGLLSQGVDPLFGERQVTHVRKVFEGRIQ